MGGLKEKETPHERKRQDMKMGIKDIFNRGKKKEDTGFDDGLDDSDAWDSGSTSKSSGSGGSYYDAGNDNFSEGTDDLILGDDSRNTGPVFNFAPWEYAIMLVELLLLIYAALVFSGIIPLF